MPILSQLRRPSVPESFRIEASRPDLLSRERGIYVNNVNHPAVHRKTPEDRDDLPLPSHPHHPVAAVVRSDEHLKLDENKLNRQRRHTIMNRRLLR